MKDQYIGDSKDYGKYRLLTTFIQTTGLKLGVQWYRTPNDETQQGSTRLSGCRDPLHQKMLELTSGKRLKLEDIEHSEMLPGNTVYFHDELCYESNQCNKVLRSAWHRKALSCLQDSDIVFLDPDIGLPTKVFIGTDYRKQKIFYAPGSAYAQFEEIQDFWDRGQSLVVFQHAQHTGIEDQLRNISRRYASLGDININFNLPNRIVRFQREKEIAPINQLGFLFYLKENHLDLFNEKFIPVLRNEHAPWSAYFSV